MQGTHFGDDRVLQPSRDLMYCPVILRNLLIWLVELVSYFLLYGCMTGRFIQGLMFQEYLVLGWVLLGIGVCLLEVLR